MDIAIHASFLPHDDPDASLAFYRDTLGFEVRNDVGYGGMRWITVGPADQPGTSIVLHPPAADPGITDDERRTIAEMMAKGTYATIILATADLATMTSVRDALRADPQVFAHNALSIVTAPGNPLHLTSLQDLRRVRVVLAGPTVPVGKAAAAALRAAGVTVTDATCAGGDVSPSLQAPNVLVTGSLQLPVLVR